MRKQLRLSGSGGQGVITAAIIFAEAAVEEGKEAVQSQSYGPEARGGASKSEVIIDDGPIFHPHVEIPDLVLAMTQLAANKYYKDLSPEGVLVVDTDLVPNPPAFLPQHKKIPPYSLVYGNPAKIVRHLREDEIAAVQGAANGHAALADYYMECLED